MHDTLLSLLRTLRLEGGASGALGPARAALAVDPRVPAELRDALDDPHEAAEVAEALLAMLGEGDSLTAMIAEAVRVEAGELAPAPAEIEASLREPFPWPVGEAVRAEAGAVSLAEGVLAGLDPAWASAMLDNALSPAAHAVAARRLRDDAEARAQLTAWAALGRQVRAAVRAEAGEVGSIWGGVATTLGIEAEPVDLSFPLREAIASEAGRVDVADAVMARVRRASVGPIAPVPRSANSGWAWGGLALAAAVLLAVFAPRAPLDRQGAATELHFATAGEIVVEDLSYAENASVQVIQHGAESEPLIIWVQEEVTL
jgi:hypothetical protein